MDECLHQNAKGGQIMAMPNSVLDWTAEMVRALPEDGKRYEVVDGALLVTPAPRWAHQEAVTELIVRLRNFLESAPRFAALISPADIEFDSRTMVQPDVFVFPTPPNPDAKSWSDIERLVLAIEVLSPGTASRDRGLKRQLYQQEGVDEYWIIDLDARIVERWKPEDERPEILRTELSWSPEPGVDELKIDLEKFFEKVCALVSE